MENIFCFYNMLLVEFGESADYFYPDNLIHRWDNRINILCWYQWSYRYVDFSE